MSELCQSQEEAALEEQPSAQAGTQEEESLLLACEIRRSEDGTILIVCQDEESAEKLVEGLKEQPDLIVRIGSVQLEEEPDISS